MRQHLKDIEKIAITGLIAGIIAISLFSTAEGTQQDLYIGTSNGELISYSNGNTDKLTEVKGVIHSIKTEKNKAFFSAKNKNGGSSIYLYDGGLETVFSTESSFHAFEPVENGLLIAYDEKEKLVRVSRSGGILNYTTLEGKPHYVKKIGGEIFVGHVNGSVEVFNPDLQRKRSIETGVWLGSFENMNGSLAVAGRKNITVTTYGHSHTKKVGHISIYRQNLSNSVQMDPTVVPHGITYLGGGKLAATNMVNGTVLYVDAEKGKITGKTVLRPRKEPYFTAGLESSSNRIFASDIEHEKLYVISKESKEVLKNIDIEKIHAIG